MIPKFRTSLLVSSFIVLSSCATVIDGSTQEVRVETPGAKDSICYLENDYARYKVVPPQTIRITKFKKPFKVNCHASGNRFKSIDIDPTLSDSVFFNVANGVIPGIIADDNASAMYEAPNMIVVDFSGMKPTAYPLPDYHHDILKNPSLFQYEEFRPGVPALQSDVYQGDYTLEKTDRAKAAEGGDQGGTAIEGSSMTPPASTQTAPSTSSSADNLTRSMNPQVFYSGDGGSASTEPEQLR